MAQQQLLRSRSPRRNGEAPVAGEGLDLQHRELENLRNIGLTPHQIAQIQQVMGQRPQGNAAAANAVPPAAPAQNPVVPIAAANPNVVVAVGPPVVAAAQQGANPNVVVAVDPPVVAAAQQGANAQVVNNAVAAGANVAEAEAALIAGVNVAAAENGLANAAPPPAEAVVPAGANEVLDVFGNVVPPDDPWTLNDWEQAYIDVFLVPETWNEARELGVITRADRQSAGQLTRDLRTDPNALRILPEYGRYKHYKMHISWECHLRVKAQLGQQNTRVNISILWSYICVQMNRFPWSPAQEGLLTRTCDRATVVKAEFEAVVRDCLVPEWQGGGRQDLSPIR